MFRDADDRPVRVPPVPGGADEPFYVPIGAFQGELYRRNAFAAHTRVEVAALTERLSLTAGMRVLDVGCGDGRHLRALATAGIEGVGIDASPALVQAARDASDKRENIPGHTGETIPLARFEVGDARDLAATPGVEEAAFDVAWSLCQGGFGTSSETDVAVVAGMAHAVRPGGTVVLTAFHTLFAVRHLAPGDAYDPVEQVHHQVSEVRGPDDTRAEFDLWTASYTVRGLRRLATDAGLEPIEVVGCEPGRYDGAAVGLDDPELLLVARRPAA